MAVGAYGPLTVTHDITHYVHSKAKFFFNVGRQTALVVGISTVRGEWRRAWGLSWSG